MRLKKDDGFKTYAIKTLVPFHCKPSNPLMSNLTHQPFNAVRMTHLPS